MRSQFFITPTIDTVIKESVDIINVCRPMISYDTEDIRAIAKEADNIILLEGQAKSSYRVSDAIEDAIIKICDVAKKNLIFLCEQNISAFLLWRKSSDSCV